MAEATEVGGWLALPAPRSPWSIHRIRLRRGRRQLVFLPLGVLKIGRTADERRLLGAEGRGSVAAARHPFWDRLTVRATSLPGAGLLMRRFGDVTAEDLPAVTALVDARLDAMAGYGRRPMLEELAPRAILARLDSADRARLAAALGDAGLPQTSMHGDLHFRNFVRDGRAYRIIDWEHFRLGGSFAFDWIDFQLQLEMAAGRRSSWAEFLARLDVGHPVIQRIAGVVEVEPEALLLYYLVIRADINVARTAAGSTDADPIVELLQHRLA